MICFLKGRIEMIGADFAALDVQGVGYRFFAPSPDLARLRSGEAAYVHVYTHVREDQFTLYGFATPAARDVFEVLIGVSGVGPRVGLAILSALSPEEIARAIALQEGKTLARAQGVGPKLGERIVRELQGKALALPAVSGDLPVADGAAVQEMPADAVAVDVLSALTNLGYKPEQARSAIRKASESMEASMEFDTLFKTTLSQLRG